MDYSFKKYYKKNIKEIILGPLFKVIEVIFELLVPIIVSKIIDEGINNPIKPDVKYIILMSSLLIGFAIVGFISAFIAQYFASKAAVNISGSIREDLYKKIQSLSNEQIDKIGVSTLLTRLTNDINQIQNGINMVLRLILRSPVVVFGAVIVSFTINVKAGFIFLIVVPLLFFIVFLIMFLCVPKYKKAQEDLDNVIKINRENLNGIRVIKAFDTVNEEIEDFENKNTKLKKSQILVNKLSYLTNPLTYGILNLFIIVLIYFGAIKVQAKELTTGNVVALYNLICQILVELIKLANLIALISKSLASTKRIKSIFSINVEKEKEINSDSIDSYISFKNVYLSYNHNDKYALSNISFDINKGETIGIIGGTGSGKTSLVNLMLKNYNFDKGEIYLNYKNINSFSAQNIRKLISIVPQKNILFKGTIKDNLLFSNKDATQEEINKAIFNSQSQTIIENKKNGINEEVEQDGRNFSGGEKQRLCIARALLKKSEILILDDSSSALDFQTDLKLRNAIKEFNKDLTLFIVSQRVNSISNADKIIVLDNGEIVGIGKHESLLKNCNVYKEIYFSQYGGIVHEK